MTAEERMAYFQGEKRRSPAPHYEQRNERNVNLIFFKIKFIIALLLFIAFLSLDYTEYEIYGIGSEKIIQEVITDFDFSEIEELAL